MIGEYFRLLLRTKVYVGDNYEEEVYADGNIRKLHYLSGGDGVFAIYVDNTMKSDSIYYIHKDYLGSIETITDENAVVLAKLNFDPWGRRRDIRLWNYNPDLKPQYFDRGYTMHEHHNIFGLINMNGRMYDPWVGRMLSPDPFIQDPTNLQNYNRYSYALNNPLKYVDPSGYHHGPVAKPDDWFAGGGSGALYVNNWFSNAYIGNPFGSYEQRHTYSYDSSSDTWRNGAGQQVSPIEVYANTNWTENMFNNFVEQNSTSLPANTDIFSIKATDGGYEFCTVDPIPYPIYSNSSSEVNLHFVYGGNGIRLGGGGYTGSMSEIDNPDNPIKKPTITQTITETPLFNISNFASVKTYTRSVIKGNSSITLNLDRKRNLSSISATTLFGTTTVGKDSYIYGKNGVSFGYDNSNYIINISIPYGGSSLGGATIYLDQNTTNQFIMFGIMTAVPEFGVYRFAFP